jgi:hypothetical protein
VFGTEKQKVEHDSPPSFSEIHEREVEGEAGLEKELV